MPADQAERWAIRCLLAFANAGAKLPEKQLMAGLEGVKDWELALATQGIRSLAGLRYEDAKPLLDEMLTTISFLAPGAGDITLGIEATLSQIEEVRTLLTLRYEALELHLGFSMADALSKSTASPAATTPASE